MTENEMELLKLIRENTDPERALQIATEIICQYIGQRESCPEQELVCLPALA